MSEQDCEVGCVVPTSKYVCLQLFQTPRAELPNLTFHFIVAAGYTSRYYHVQTLPVTDSTDKIYKIRTSVCMIVAYGLSK